MILTTIKVFCFGFAIDRLPPRRLHPDQLPVGFVDEIAFLEQQPDVTPAAPLPEEFVDPVLSDGGQGLSADRDGEFYQGLLLHRPPFLLG